MSARGRSSTRASVALQLRPPARMYLAFHEIARALQPLPAARDDDRDVLRDRRIEMRAPWRLDVRHCGCFGPAPALAALGGCDRFAVERADDHGRTGLHPGLASRLAVNGKTRAMV